MVASTTPPPGRIFISYRREETAYPAAWLFDRLADHFGEGQIFKDVDSIELGDDFVQVITDAVGSCDVLLALIGDRWTTITDEDGRRRLDNPDDFVRLEIEAALARNVRLVPILVGGAAMPRPGELPGSLAKLVRRHALELSPIRFESDTDKLVKVLDKTLEDLQSRSTETTVARRGIEQDSTTRDRGATGHYIQHRRSEQNAPPSLQRVPHSTMRLGLVAAGALVAVLLAVALLVAVVVSGNGDKVTRRDVVVDGTKPWTDSHIDVEAGDEVQLTARGEVFHNEGSSIGPEGFRNRPDLLTPVDIANHAGLLARVGNTGEPFYVGRGITFTAERDGRLFLGINDGGLENNRGSFTATVTVSAD